MQHSKVSALLRKMRRLVELLTATEGTRLESRDRSRLSKLTTEITEEMEAIDPGEMGEALVGTEELSGLVEASQRLREAALGEATMPGITRAADELSELIGRPLFASKLRAARTQAGQSLRELERRSGVSNSYISQLESGASAPPSIKIAARLARALGLSEDELREFYLEQFTPAMPESTQMDLLWDPAVRDILAVAQALNPVQRALLASLARAVQKHLANDD